MYEKTNLLADVDATEQPRAARQPTGDVGADRTIEVGG